MAPGTWHVMLSYMNERDRAEEPARAACAIFEPLVDDPQTPTARAHLANALVALARSLLISPSRAEETRVVLDHMLPLLEGLPHEVRAELGAARQEMLGLIQYWH